MPNSVTPSSATLRYVLTKLFLVEVRFDKIVFRQLKCSGLTVYVYNHLETATDEWQHHQEPRQPTDPLDREVVAEVLPAPVKLVPRHQEVKVGRVEAEHEDHEVGHQDQDLSPAPVLPAFKCNLEAVTDVLQVEDLANPDLTKHF